MSKGGARPGAGRKKGAPNKKTAEKIAAIEAAGITPLDFMLKIMRGEPPKDADAAKRLAWQALAFEAAKAAAPYCHPKLSAIEHTGKDGGPLKAEVTVRFV